MRRITLASIVPVLCGLFALALWSPESGRCDTFYANAAQGGGQDWTKSIWTNGLPIGTAFTNGVYTGNSYIETNNGVVIQNSTTSTHLRTPTNNPATTTPALETFGGDSLTLLADTELFVKKIQFVGGVSSPQNPTIVNFPGTNGNPGLIMNGGILYAADSGTTFQVTGQVQVVSTSYICPGSGNNPGGTPGTGRIFDFTGTLTGSGDLVWFQETNTANFVSGRSNTFSGQWIVKTGWLVGTNKFSPNNGNPLGTNNIICDPGYNFPNTDWNIATFVIPSVPQAIIETSYDWNNAGTLTLTNGGQMRLHQDDCFAAVTITTVNFQSTGQTLTTNLGSGLHFYTELRANYPDVFPSGGSGAITVRPYTTAGFPPPLGPQILIQPSSEMLYAGETASFTASASGPGTLFYQWQTNGVNIGNGGQVSGATTTNLVITNVSSANAVNYTLIVTNSGGASTSSVATLTIVPFPTEAYASTVLGNGPFAFYQLNETGDPSTNNTAAFDFVGGFNGIYGVSAQNGFNGIMGPQPGSGFPGFASGNLAAGFQQGLANSHITLPPFAINTNTLTFTAWINPNQDATQTNGIIFCRGNGTTAGLGFSGNLDGNGNHSLSYTWNGQFATTSWNPALPVPSGQWSFVALVITPTNSTIYLLNSTNLYSATQVIGNANQTFNASTLIGDDSNGAGGSRSFPGDIDDVAFFASSLSQSQLITLYTNATGGSSVFAPAIDGQPAPVTIYSNQTAQFIVGGGSSLPLGYQWQAGTSGSGPFTNLSDGGQISGSTNLTLIVSNATPANVGYYQIVISNALGAATSSPALLNVLNPAGTGTNWVTTANEGFQTDWDTSAIWEQGPLPGSSGFFDNASTADASYPGSTFEIWTNASVRTPYTVQNATFPGLSLQLDGNGVLAGTWSAAAGLGQLIMKADEVGSPGSVTFNRLIMNGGQIDDASPGSPGAGTWPNPINTAVSIIAGEMDIMTNTPIYNDNSGSQIVDRGLQINALLTGTGTIQYLGYQSSFQTSFANAVLNIANPANTFSGQWDVKVGVLLGSAANSLGTNTITIESDGALETTYDINNPAGSLIITNNGRVFLHQIDTFGSVTINSTSLANGTYSWSQLHTAYPNNFPASWTQQSGSSFSTASGSIKVGTAPPPPPTIKSISINGGNVVIGGTNNAGAGGTYHVLSSTNISIPLTNWGILTNGSFDSSGNFSSTNAVGTNAQQFYILQVP
jgi:hypothetical protein